MTGALDSTLKARGLSSNAHPTPESLRTLRKHAAAVTCVAVLLNGRDIVSGSSDRTLRVWETWSGTCIRTLSGHTGEVYCVAILTSGDILSGSGDNMLKLWEDLERARLVTQVALRRTHGSNFAGRKIAEFLFRKRSRVAAPAPEAPPPRPPGPLPVQAESVRCGAKSGAYEPKLLI